MNTNQLVTRHFSRVTAFGLEQKAKEFKESGAKVYTNA